MNRWMRVPIFLLVTASLWCAGSLPASDALEDNEIVQALIVEGVELASGDRVPLPSPLSSSEQNGAQQSAVIDRVTKKIPRDEFLRNSVVSPFVLQIDTVDGQRQEGRVAQQIHLWFVAYGSLQTVRDEDLLSNLIGVAKQSGPSTSKSESTADLLQPDELRARGLSTIKSEQRRDWFVRFTAPLLDRVQVQGVWHVVETSMPGSIVLASNLERQFARDRQYPNQWRTIRQDEFGKTSLGEAQPYAGWGGYAQAVPVHERPGALLVECHTVFSEPAAWFGGTNQLRAKLPIVVQDNVRKFRRQLQEAERAR